MVAVRSVIESGGACLRCQ